MKSILVRDRCVLFFVKKFIQKSFYVNFHAASIMGSKVALLIALLLAASIALMVSSVQAESAQPVPEFQSPVTLVTFAALLTTVAIAMTVKERHGA
jgi:hypothetical protein